MTNNITTVESIHAFSGHLALKRQQLFISTEDTADKVITRWIVECQMQRYFYDDHYTAAEHYNELVDIQTRSSRMRAA